MLSSLFTEWNWVVWVYHVLIHSSVSVWIVSIGGYYKNATNIYFTRLHFSWANI